MDAKILYIDDEEDLVELAALFFEDEEIHVETATAFEEALGLIRAKQYDLIISDVNMPTGNGQELLELVRKEGSFSGKTILVTGSIYGEKEIQRQNYDFVIHKPIEFHDLLEKVKELIKF